MFARSRQEIWDEMKPVRDAAEMRGAGSMAGLDVATRHPGRNLKHQVRGFDDTLSAFEVARQAFAPDDPETEST